MWRPTLLGLTSLIFIIPFLLSLYRKGCPSYLSVNLGASVICSQIYHGFYHHERFRAVFKPIDMAVCHLAIVLFVWTSLHYCTYVLTSRYVLGMYSTILYAALTYWVMDMSQSDFWHAVLHVITGLGASYYFLDPYCFASPSTYVPS